MRGKTRNQLVLPFIAEMERAADQAREDEAERSRIANETAMLNEIVKNYPITAYERKVIPEGVRLSRIVPFPECHICKYATKDHSIKGMFGIDRSEEGRESVPLICLKDWYNKKGRKVIC